DGAEHRCGADDPRPCRRCGAAGDGRTLGPSAAPRRTDVVGDGAALRVLLGRCLPPDADGPGPARRALQVHLLSRRLGPARALRPAAGPGGAPQPGGRLRAGKPGDDDAHAALRPSREDRRDADPAPAPDRMAGGRATLTRGDRTGSSALARYPNTT